MGTENITKSTKMMNLVLGILASICIILGVLSFVATDDENIETSSKNASHQTNNSPF